MVFGGLIVSGLPGVVCLLMGDRIDCIFSFIGLTCALTFSSLAGDLE